MIKRKQIEWLQHKEKLMKPFLKVSSFPTSQIFSNRMECSIDTNILLSIRTIYSSKTSFKISFTWNLEPRKVRKTS